MNFIIKHRVLLIKFGKIIAFIAAILCTTKLMLAFGTLANNSTTAFCFIIIVLFSAFFGDFLVALTTSIVATLCFDYYFLPPFGIFNITSFFDWISLATFLLASVMISRLTASAAENKVQVGILNKSLVQIKEFGEWLLSMPNDNLTLSVIAKEALNVFSLDYCSIHVYGAGKWQHFTGAAASGISQEIDNKLKNFQDHQTDVMELAEENLLGVEYLKINKGKDQLALLAVKSRTIPSVTIKVIAYVIGLRLSTILESKEFLKQNGEPDKTM